VLALSIEALANYPLYLTVGIIAWLAKMNTPVFEGTVSEDFWQ
jgi:hypothetical protein